MAEQEALARLVVIGASAGGIDALSTLVSTLRADFPAPIVIAQHLHPEHRSHLTEILQSRCSLTVRTVAEHEPQPLAPGVVLVVPADRHVEVTHREVSLLVDGKGRPKPSVDLLLSSAAEVYGEGLIAVILTGMGSDGADGAHVVKQEGGTVIIQDPVTARYPEMPRSLAPVTVDIVAEIDRIGLLLHDLVSGGNMPVNDADSGQLDAFLDDVRQHSGIDFGTYKPTTIGRRLQHRIAATSTNDLAGYRRYLRRRPEEYQRLISTFLIKVTEFFRDPEMFDYLRDRVLPEMITHAREAGELRLWSAGCATGEEAYSLAILVSELLGDELNELTVRIFATDVDSEAVDFARRGIYPSNALAQLPTELIDRYFSRNDDSTYEVKTRIRALTVFGQHDLGQRSPFPRIDLILCRNVLIYFTSDLQKRALQVFAFSLRDQGMLVLGKAETISPVAELFAPDSSRLKTYRRTGERSMIPPARLHTKVAAPGPLPRPASRLNDVGDPPPDFTRLPQRIGERADQILRHLPLGLVVVDRRYDVQSINHMARRLLGIPGPALGKDLIHLVQNTSLTPLRTAIDAAFRGQEAGGIYAIAPTATLKGEASFLEISCYAERSDPGVSRPDTVIILIQDASSREQERRTTADAWSQRDEHLSASEEQVKRLGDANRQLLIANEDLTVANTELRNANDDLLVAHEESQAATEEVETLNEELQATNEELETLNEELQATVEELNTTNDDLQARSVELHDLALSHEEQRQSAETERERLRAILTGLADAVLVIDADERPVLTNHAYERTFGANVDWAPWDDGGHPLPPAEWPQRRAARGETFSVTFTMIHPDGSRCWYEANGRPLDGDHDPGRSVLVIRDITERSLRRLQDEFLALASHELRTPLTALSGSIQLLQRRIAAAGNDERLQRFATSALDQVRRLEEHIDELMEVSRLQSGKLRLRQQPVDLVKLAQWAVETADFLANGQTIRLDAPASALTVAGDDRRLEQVLLNMLTNAIHYSPGAAAIDVRLRQRDDRAEIEIEDYGAGIPAEALPDIFSRFFQAVRSDRMEQSGLGLGLFIAREIITAHQGTIDVRSTVGEGTTFTVSLPLLTERSSIRD